MWPATESEVVCQVAKIYTVPPNHLLSALAVHFLSYILSNFLCVSEEGTTRGAKRSSDVRTTQLTDDARVSTAQWDQQTLNFQ